MTFSNGWKFKYGDYKEKTIEQAALADYKGYLFVKDSIGRGWSVNSRLEEVVEKLNNFVPSVKCSHCDDIADYLSIIELHDMKHDSYKDIDVYGLIDLSVSPEHVLCEDHKNYVPEGIAGSASVYPIKFDIITDFNARNKDNKYKMPQDAISKVFHTLRACAGFRGKATEKNCSDFIDNLKQK
jgi:hypothetical protein